MKKGLVYLTFGVVLFGCDSSDPAPMALIRFSAEKTLVEANEPVSFSNNTEHASRYEWDFGDGKSSTIQNPTATYAQPGQYTVTLTAYNADNEPTSSKTRITVGKRYLSHFLIKEISWLDGNGGAWDSDGSGPDVFFRFGMNNPLEFVSLGVADLQSNSLPLRLDPENEVVITTNQWGFHLIDQEPFDEESMAYWQFDPTEQRNINGKVVEKLTGERYAIELHMEIR